MFKYFMVGLFFPILLINIYLTKETVSIQNVNNFPIKILFYFFLFLIQQVFYVKPFKYLLISYLSFFENFLLI